MARYKGKTDQSTIPARVRDLGYASYAEYLRSDHWADVRKRFSESGERQDCKCGKPAADLHHKTYERLGAEDLSDLEALCRDCHRSLHKPKRRRKKKRPRSGYMQGSARRRREHASRTKSTKPSKTTVCSEKGLGL